MMIFQKFDVNYIKLPRYKLDNLIIQFNYFLISSNQKEIIFLEYSHNIKIDTSNIQYTYL